MLKPIIALLFIISILPLDYAISIYSPQELSGNFDSLFWSPWNVTGIQRLVVIAVEFKDVKHTTPGEKIAERIMNVSQYFGEISYGEISVIPSIFVGEWKVLNETMAYYGEDDFNTKSKDKRGWDFIKDSMKAWKDEVDFSKFDCLTIIHAGEDQSSNPDQTSLLWRMNYGPFRRTRRRSIQIDGEEFSYWGFAYDSEFEEWGLIAHEFGHSLGLPDLYDIEEKEEFIDGFSVMGYGDRLGRPEGTCPSQLEAWSKIMLGWITPTFISLEASEKVYTIYSLDWSQGQRAIIIPISNTTYYIIESRRKVGYDSYLSMDDDHSLLVTLIDDSKRSGGGIVTIPEGGVLQTDQVFKDSKNRVFVACEGFVGSVCEVKLSTRITSLSVSYPDRAETFSPVYIQISARNLENESVQNLVLHIILDNVNYTTLRTNEYGEATVVFNFGLFGIGSHHVKMLSPQILDGQFEGEFMIKYPLWFELIRLALVLVPVLVIVAAIYTFIQSKRTYTYNMN